MSPVYNTTFPTNKKEKVSKTGIQVSLQKNKKARNPLKIQGFQAFYDGTSKQYRR